MERRVHGLPVPHAALPWILGALLALSACESPIGPHADQETWVFELTHVYLEEEGGERGVIPWSIIRDEVTADGERRSEWRLDWGILTLHPDGSGTRETRHRVRTDGGEWEVTEQEWDLHWGEWRSHQVRLRLSLEGIVVINPPRPVIARVRDRGSRLVIPSFFDPSSSRLEHWVRVR